MRPSSATTQHLVHFLLSSNGLGSLGSRDGRDFQNMNSIANKETKTHTFKSWIPIQQYHCLKAFRKKHYTRIGVFRASEYQ